MIKSLEVKGLNEKFDYTLPPGDQDSFNQDLNIFTGANGRGKTTLLKLLWYLTSGNLERIIPDVPFKTIEIQADRFELSMDKVNENQVKFDWKFNSAEVEDNRKEGSVVVGLEHVDTESVELEYVDEVHKLNENIAATMKRTLFLSTFRRLEGGFTTDRRSILSVDEANGVSRVLRERITDVLRRALSEFASSLSHGDHNFTSSFSTRDIVQLLSREDADLSGQIDQLQSEALDDITKRIQEYYKTGKESEAAKPTDAVDVLKNIQKHIEDTGEERTKLSNRFLVLNEIVKDIYKDYGGIRITDNLILPATKGKPIISSDKLSSGEKQFLGLVCYNAFHTNATIFIDEPELSLHTDLQRILLPILLQQGTENQFFVATHSPFIYARYPGREFNL